MVTEIKENDVLQFVRDHADTGLKRDLLSFWSKYRYAKFTPGIITRALDCKRKVDVEEALECFVEAELLHKHTRQGLPFYCLNPSRREWVLDLPAHRGTFRPFCGRG